MRSSRILLLLTGVLLAHIPVLLTRSNATRGAAPALPDGTVSFAFFGAVGVAGEIRTVRADLRAGQDLAVELLVPAHRPERDLAEEDLPVVTVTTPSGTTTVLAPTGREPFDEPHSGTSYLRLLSTRLLAEDGTHTVSVTGRAPARFSLSIGDEERQGEVSGARVATMAEVGHWYETGPAALD